jgi:aspartyl protease family protein
VHLFLSILIFKVEKMKSLFAIILFALAPVCFGLEVEAKMLAQGSAILMIDGQQRMLREGNRSPEGVLLVSADGKQAVLEINGKRKTISLSRGIVNQFKATDKTEIRIASGAGGHYQTKGLINGIPVDFLVDTGATSVAMNHFEADRLGIDYRGGAPIEVNTANGTAKAFLVTLSKVSVGNIVINQVTAVVSSTDSPSIVLLGNSYLSKVDFKIDQGVLVLKEK